MVTVIAPITAVARVNGVALCAPDEHTTAEELRQQAFVTALRQYLRVLAGRAEVEGVDLDAADTALLQ